MHVYLCIRIHTSYIHMPIDEYIHIFKCRCLHTYVYLYMLSTLRNTNSTFPSMWPSENAFASMDADEVSMWRQKRGCVMDTCLKVMAKLKVEPAPDKVIPNFLLSYIE